MNKIKESVKKMPVLPSLFRALRNRYIRFQYSSKTTEEIFTKIFRDNKWNGKESVSGTGSDVHQTRAITKELPVLLNEFNVSSILDIPCGDFHWMQNVDLSNIDYTGADIVKEMIEKNIEKYGKDCVRFQSLNLIKDKLPKVDLVFCRDCLLHLSFEDIFLALNNVCNSQSEYILTTTFTDRKDNSNIVTGQGRVINLQLAPFMFPKPLITINEGCTEADGAFEDKALMLWRIADIRKSLSTHGD